MSEPFPWKRLFLTISLGLVPPSLLGILGKEVVLEHPFWCLVLLQLYWLALVVGGFVLEVLAVLKKRWPRAVANWLDSVIQRSLSEIGFRARYQRQLVFRHRVLNVQGLRTQGTFTLELEKVFVELRVAPVNPQQTNLDPIRDNVLPGNRSIWEFLFSDLEPFRCLAVIGPPGSGKTTLLQHLVLAFCKNEQRRHHPNSKALIPIFIFLRDHVQAIVSDTPPTIAELATIQEETARLQPPALWFERQMRHSKCLVLLDGLDELGEVELRKRAASWVDAQIELYGSNRFIVTSRPHGYSTNPLLRATILEVQPFTLQKVQSFVESWYAANEVLSFGKDDQGVKAEAAKRASDLMARLKSTPTLLRLAVNPLLVTMIAIVHRYRGALPGRRVELYTEICDVLLGHLKEAKGIVDKLTPLQKRSVLQPLALYMMKRRIPEITAMDAAKIIRAPLKRVGILKNDEASPFLKQLEGETGLLIEREAGVFSFAHMTFQEYLAATHLLEQKVGGEEVLVGHLGDSWWRETIRLYVAQGDATNVIRACLEKSGQCAAILAFAFECLSEARTVDPRAREQLTSKIVQGADSYDPGIARLAAEVLLSIRLLKLSGSTDADNVDSSYVTCSEYQLFLDSAYARGAFLKPDHWRTPRFPMGKALEPITGVRKSDALAFCNWLSEQTVVESDLEQCFRLPTAEEAASAQSPPAIADGRLGQLRELPTATWCTGSGSYMTGEIKQALEHTDLVQRLNAYLAPGTNLNRWAVQSVPPPHETFDLQRLQERVVTLARLVEERFEVSTSRRSWFVARYVRARISASGFKPDQLQFYHSREEQLRANLSESVADQIAISQESLIGSVRDVIIAAEHFISRDKSLRDDCYELLGHTCKALTCAIECLQAGIDELKHDASGVNPLPSTDLAKWWHPLGPKDAEVTLRNCILGRDNCLDLLWAFLILQARMEGRFPALESIRIVRCRASQQ